MTCVEKKWERKQKVQFQSTQNGSINWEEEKSSCASTKPTKVNIQSLHLYRKNFYWSSLKIVFRALKLDLCKQITLKMMAVTFRKTNWKKVNYLFLLINRL